MKSKAADCTDECAVKRTAAILDGKWTTLVLRDLMSGKKRYFELEQSLEGISPRLLTARLRFLEERGIVTRRVFPTNPPTTEYELTNLGLKLRGVIDAMATFGSGLG